MHEHHLNCCSWACFGLDLDALLVQRQAYNCAHNVLQAHAAAVQEFRRIVPGGKISINLNSDWGEPYSQSSPADKVAAHPQLLPGPTLSGPVHH